MFTITNHKGFWIKFQNGWTVSVQWGPANYCDNYATTGFDEPEKTAAWQSEDAEIAAWDANGVWLSFGGDTVKGHCSADEVAAFIREVSQFTR